MMRRFWIFENFPVKHLACFGLMMLSTLSTIAVAGDAADTAPTPQHLNIVMILIDDLGWADLGCYGSTYHETPRIDALAAGGMKFDDFYAAGPVCSPTRASIVSGQYPARLGLTNFLSGKAAKKPGGVSQGQKLIAPLNARQLPLDIVTFAERLQRAGYRTGYFGKWHLGKLDRYGPDKQGFDDVLVTPSMRHFAPLATYPRTKLAEGTYLADLLTDRTLDFIQRNKDRQFCAVLSHFAVHIPLQAKEAMIRHFAEKEKPDDRPSHPTYAAMLAHVDESCGRILDQLDRLGLSDRTVVVFTSDNGGYTGRHAKLCPDGPPTSNTPLRGGKGMLYEGGTRVPLLVRWPGVTPAGSVCREPAATIDLYPTFLDIAGVRTPIDGSLDGVSLAPLLRNPRVSLDRDAIYFHFPHYHAGPPAGAVRAGPWKLIEFFEEGQLELYNLDDDLGELENLAERKPREMQRLRHKLQRWRAAIGAKMPRETADRTDQESEPKSTQSKSTQSKSTESKSAASRPTQWRVSELTFTADRAYDDPINQVDLFATFTGPGGVTLRINGFWDGGHTWRIRFTPTLPGKWSYETHCTVDNDAGLTAKQGTLEVEPATGDNPLYAHGGFLTVSQNKRYLTYSDGTPFFWLGDSWWFCPSRRVPIDGSSNPAIPSMFKHLVDIRKQQRFTVVQWAFSVTEGETYEFAGMYNGRCDPAYWQQVDRYFRYANDAELLPVIGFGWGPSHDDVSLQQLQTLWKYALARYGAYATTFLICGEYNKGSRGPARKDPAIREARIARIFELGRFLKSSDPYKRAFGIHPTHSEIDPRPTWDEPWCDLIMVQGGHDQNKSHRPYRIACYGDLRARPEIKPWVETESTFEGIEYAYWNRPGGNGSAEVRASAYTPLQYGACGFSYGANSLWYPTQDENDQTFAQWGRPIPWWEAVRRPGAAQMTHLRNCYESVAWWRLLPVESSRALDWEHGEADKDYPPLVRAERDQTLLIYFPRRKGDCTVWLKASPARYRVSLFNPRTGKSNDSELICRAQRTLLPPLPDRQDWVMILRQQSD